MGEAKRRKAAADAANAFAKVYRNWPEVPLGFNPETDKGTVNIISAAHDDDCPAVGTGIGCKCNPDIRRFRYPTHQ